MYSLSFLEFSYPPECLSSFSYSTLIKLAPGMHLILAIFTLKGLVVHTGTMSRVISECFPVTPTFMLFYVSSPPTLCFICYLLTVFYNFCCQGATILFVLGFIFKFSYLFYIDMSVCCYTIKGLRYFLRHLSGAKISYKRNCFFGGYKSFIKKIN